MFTGSIAREPVLTSLMSTTACISASLHVNPVSLATASLPWKGARWTGGDEMRWVSPTVATLTVAGVAALGFAATSAGLSGGAG